MLLRLAIKNLAVIEETELELGSGLTVLTGETGAGKSIIIAALGLVLGDRARADLVREGASQGEVQALIRVAASSHLAAQLADLDLLTEPLASDPIEVIVRRIIPRNGRGRVYINDSLVKVATLQDLMRGLVDISSQHQHTKLLDASGHLELLDRFGGLEEELNDYGVAWQLLLEARAHHEALMARDRERVQREDFVNFQLDEIGTIDPQVDEDDLLAQERERLIHAERLVEGTREVEGALDGRESACDSLVSALRSLQGLAAIDPELAQLMGRLEEARLELEDVVYELKAYRRQVEGFDPRRLSQVEERLQALQRLKRKHGGDLVTVLARRDELQREREAFGSLSLELAEAEAAVTQADEKVRCKAQTLSASRRRIKEVLETRINRELEDLSMPGARLEVALESGAPRDQGAESVQLLLETNHGGGAVPLARIASGGELSRLLLAFKRTLLRVDSVQTCVFDEVDAGVGGAIAEVIGLKLLEIARERQVLCITHLPQIAALGATHMRVQKHRSGTKLSTTKVSQLSPRERSEELARMLGGVEITQRTRDHAQELLTRRLKASAA